MAGEITNIRNGLQTRLETISGLQVYDHEPDAAAVTPAASIAFVGWTPNETFAGASAPTGDRTYRFVITVRLSGAVPEEQWQALDDYINPTGTNSILAAIDGDATLGSLVEWTVITPGEPIDVTDRESKADAWFYVQEFPVECWVTG